MKAALRTNHPEEHPGEDRPRSGTVSRIVAQARRTDRVSVYLDGEFAFGLPADVAVAAGIIKGRSLDEAEVASLLADGALHEAKQLALALLSRRAFTEAGMRQRLVARGHTESTAERVVARLVELGYLDDARFAASHAAGRARARQYGPRRILQDLRRHGVPEAVAQQAVLALQESVDSVQTALDAALKAWPRISREPDRRRRAARLYGFLARRGFDSDTILSVLSRLESQDHS